MNELFESIATVQRDMEPRFKEADSSIIHIPIDGNMAAVHTQILSVKSEPYKGGLRRVHLFRFEDDEIAEYWDVTQEIGNDMPNASGAF